MPYFVMIVGIYATLGLFLIAAARDPLAHAPLIRFTAVSSAVHAGIMALQALNDPMRRGHLTGDVPALLLVTLAFGVLPPKAQREGGRVLCARGRAGRYAPRPLTVEFVIDKSHEPCAPSSVGGSWSWMG